MLEQSGILAAPGMGTVFLVFVLLCYLTINKIIKARKKNNDVNMLPVNVSDSSSAAGADNTAGVVAAIAAAVNEYRKRNF